MRRCRLASQLACRQLVGAAVLLAAASILVMPLTAAAQTQDNGTISFLVLDPNGAPLPSVTVTLSGPQGSWTAFTTLDGTARFQGLVPAAYDATVAVSGFATLVRTDLRSTAGQTTTVRATMQISAVEEIVTVIGESPLIDVTAINLGATVSDQIVQTW